MDGVVKFALIAALSTSSAAAQDRTAEAAMERFRQLFKSQVPACPTSSAPDEVTVCGRRAQTTYRLPLPVEPLPGTRAVGDRPDQLEASEVGSEPCSTIGPNGGCGSYVPILPFVAWVAKMAVKAVKVATEEEEE